MRNVVTGILTTVTVLAVLLGTGALVGYLAYAAPKAVQAASYEHPASLDDAEIERIYGDIERVIPDARDWVEIRFDADTACAEIAIACVLPAFEPHVIHLSATGEYNRDSDVVIHEAAHVAAYAQGVTIPAEFGAIDDSVRGDEAFAECVVEAILGHGSVYLDECPDDLQRLALDLIAP